MKTTNILHLTDLHIKDPKSLNEKLREGFYVDYINSLFNLIESKLSVNIDYLICTGDIVDKGIVDNFVHAGKIFEYLSKRGGISKDNIFINIGNHDLVVKSNTEGDRIKFDKFIAEHSVVGPSLNKIYHLKCDDTQKICFCIFDSIFNENEKINANEVSKTIFPSILSDDTIDDIVNQIDSTVPKDYLLIIGCHFPMIVSPDGEMYSEIPEWIDKHLWKSGKTIAKRLIARRIKGKTFFLFGDGHLPDFWAYSNNIQFFMTGMFGGDFINVTYKNSAGERVAFNKTNQTKLLRFNSDHSIESITTFNYNPEGYKFDSQSGVWTLSDSSIPRIKKNDLEIPLDSSPIINQDEEQNKSPTILIEDTQVLASTPIELIASHIQTEILSEITKRHLYTVARTSSSNNESSLGWLPINQLFLKTELLTRCIDRASEWLIAKTPEKIEYEDFIIIGLGFWGAILSSQISVRLGIRNFCISSNLSGVKNNNYESLENLCKYLKYFDKLKKIIVVTDVISTGNSIVRVKKTIEIKCGSKDYWAAISVIGDKKQQRSASITEYNLLGSFCVDLPIPIINNDFLPDESIFPIEYDYR